MYHNPYPSGHTGYGGAGAPSGPPRHPASAPPGSYSAHHESLSIASNPEAFANMFRSHLASLTFNSKPIITNLTILAHEHVYRMSTVVARCLEEHILNVSRSPAFSSFIDTASDLSRWTDHPQKADGKDMFGLVQRRS